MRKRAFIDQNVSASVGTMVISGSTEVTSGGVWMQKVTLGRGFDDTASGASSTAKLHLKAMKSIKNEQKRRFFAVFRQKRPPPGPKTFTENSEKNITAFVDKFRTKIEIGHVEILPG